MDSSSDRQQAAASPSSVAASAAVAGDVRPMTRIVRIQPTRITCLSPSNSSHISDQSISDTLARHKDVIGHLARMMYVPAIHNAAMRASEVEAVVAMSSRFSLPSLPVAAAAAAASSLSTQVSDASATTVDRASQVMLFLEVGFTDAPAGASTVVKSGVRESEVRYLPYMDISDGSWHFNLALSLVPLSPNARTSSSHFVIHFKLELFVLSDGDTTRAYRVTPQVRIRGGGASTSDEQRQQQQQQQRQQQQQQ